MIYLLPMYLLMLLLPKKPGLSLTLSWFICLVFNPFCSVVEREYWGGGVGGVGFYIFEGLHFEKIKHLINYSGKKFESFIYRTAITKTKNNYI
jgi:hypothetical protein